LDDGIAKGPYDVVLAEDVVEGFRAVFTGKDLIAHAPSVGMRAGLSSLTLQEMENFLSAAENQCRMFDEEAD
jgi:hypothetical protein